jgi:hypothetical protein
MRQRIESPSCYADEEETFQIAETKYNTSAPVPGTTVTPTRTLLGLRGQMSEARITLRGNWIHETNTIKKNTEKLTIAFRPITDAQPPIKKPVRYMGP